MILHDWLHNLAEVQRTEKFRVMNRRIVLPYGTKPPLATLLASRIVSRLDRPGMPTETLAVLSLPVSEKYIEFRDTETRFIHALGALICFVLDRRVEILDEWPLRDTKNKKIIWSPMAGIYEHQLLAPPEKDDFTKLFDDSLVRLCSADPATADTLLAAIELHYGATSLIVSDLRAAYTLLVAGIETLSRQFGSPPDEWEAWEEAKSWEKFGSAAGLTDDQRAGLRIRLMKNRQLRIKETFAEYPCARLPANFWDTNWTHWLPYGAAPEHKIVYQRTPERDELRNHLPSDLNSLRSALHASYDARSRFVHVGERSVDFLTAIGGRRPDESVQPLSYVALRAILTALIRRELQDIQAAMTMPTLS